MCVPMLVQLLISVCVTVRATCGRPWGGTAGEGCGWLRRAVPGERGVRGVSARRVRFSCGSCTSARYVWLSVTVSVREQERVDC